MGNTEEDIIEELKETKKVVVKDVELMLEKWKKLGFNSVSSLLFLLEETCMYLKYMEKASGVFDLKEILKVSLLKAENAYNKGTNE